MQGPGTDQRRKRPRYHHVSEARWPEHCGARGLVADPNGPCLEIKKKSRVTTVRRMPSVPPTKELDWREIAHDCEELLYASELPDSIASPLAMDRGPFGGASLLPSRTLEVVAEPGSSISSGTFSSPSRLANETLPARRADRDQGHEPVERRESEPQLPQSSAERSIHQLADPGTDPLECAGSTRVADVHADVKLNGMPLDGMVTPRRDIVHLKLHSLQKGSRLSLSLSPAAKWPRKDSSPSPAHEPLRVAVPVAAPSHAQSKAKAVAVSFASIIDNPAPPGGLDVSRPSVGAAHAGVSDGAAAEDVVEEEYSTSDDSDCEPWPCELSSVPASVAVVAELHVSHAAAAMHRKEHRQLVTSREARRWSTQYQFKFEKALLETHAPVSPHPPHSLRSQHSLQGDLRHILHQWNQLRQLPRSHAPPHKLQPDLWRCDTGCMRTLWQAQTERIMARSRTRMSMRRATPKAL